ncbi:MAG: carbohydrate-binding domain-containing protein [Clostridiales bacterium]|jgi:hypothetical protein|nr:carbohydrate-binding domain-containing protein [Clostridiales bacterium]
MRLIKNITKRFLSAALTVTVMAGLITVTPLSVFADISYVDAAGDGKTRASATEITGGESLLDIAATGAGWYFVKGNGGGGIPAPSPITINNSVKIDGDVNVILEDGATLTISGGLSSLSSLSSGASLTIWGQSGGTGKLIVNSGAENGVDLTGNLIINGGVVEITSAAKGISAEGDVEIQGGAKVTIISEDVGIYAGTDILLATSNGDPGVTVTSTNEDTPSLEAAAATISNDGYVELHANVRKKSDGYHKRQWIKVGSETNFDDHGERTRFFAGTEEVEPKDFASLAYYGMTIDPEVHSFEPAIEGYTLAYAEELETAFELKNESTESLTNVTAALNSTNAFKIVIDSIPGDGAIPPGGASTVRVRPETGLSPGTYVDTLDVSSNGVHAPVFLSFVVHPAAKDIYAEYGPVTVFRPSAVGYDTVFIDGAAKTITVANTGGTDLKNLTVTIVPADGEDPHFIIAEPIPDAVLVGDIGEFYIQPKQGLPEGIYIDTLKITDGEGLNITQELIFIVASPEMNNLDIDYMNELMRQEYGAEYIDLPPVLPALPQDSAFMREVRNAFGAGPVSALPSEIAGETTDIEQEIYVFVINELDDDFRALYINGVKLTEGDDFIHMPLPGDWRSLISGLNEGSTVIAVNGKYIVNSENNTVNTVAAEFDEAENGAISIVAKNFATNLTAPDPVTPPTPVTPVTPPVTPVTPPVTPVTPPSGGRSSRSSGSDTTPPPANTPANTPASNDTPPIGNTPARPSGTIPAGSLNITPTPLPGDAPTAGSDNPKGDITNGDNENGGANTANTDANAANGDDSDANTANNANNGSNNPANNAANPTDTSPENYTANSRILDFPTDADGNYYFALENSDSNLTFRLDLPLEEFRELYLDGEPLTPGEDYETRSGSTIVTIYASRLAKLENGARKVETRFAGEVVSLEFLFENKAAANTAAENTGADARPVPQAAAGSGAAPEPVNSAARAGGFPVVWVAAGAAAAFAIAMIFRRRRKQ